MNTSANPEPRKLSGPDFELTKLKLMWRDTFTEADREYWRGQLLSARSQADLRQELNAKYGLNLSHDMQLTRLRQWDSRSIALEEEKQKAATDEAELKALGLTGEKLRLALIERMKARAYNEGDFKLALKAISADVKVETLQLGRDKFNVASRAKIDLALDQLARHIKNNVPARAAYEAFCDIVKSAAA